MTWKNVSAALEGVLQGVGLIALFRLARYLSDESKTDGNGVDVPYWFALVFVAVMVLLLTLAVTLGCLLWRRWRSR